VAFKHVTMASNKTAANSLWQGKAMPLLHHKCGLLDCCNHTKDSWCWAWRWAGANSWHQADQHRAIV